MVKQVYVSHPTAIVESDRIGGGTRIWAFAHVLAGACVGENCNLGDHVFVEGGATIGNRVTVKNGVMLWSGVHLGDDVFVGPGVLFTNDRFPRSPRAEVALERYADSSWLVRTVVATGASIGAGAVIVGGIEIGAYAMVAAGAVVTRTVPPYALVLGNPARQHGWVSPCGDKLQFGEDSVATCPRTGAKWLLEDARVISLSEIQEPNQSHVGSDS